MTFLKYLLFLSCFILVCFLLPGCAQDNTEQEIQNTAAYIESIDQWHQERQAKLKAPDGALTLEKTTLLLRSMYSIFEPAGRHVPLAHKDTCAGPEREALVAEL